MIPPPPPIIFLHFNMFSKTKVENILGLFFNTLNLTFYLATMTSAAMKIRLITDKNVSHIITCIYAL